MGDTIEVKALLDEALALGLSGAEHCARVPIETLAANYNGCGPEWAPDWLRKLLTKCHKSFLACVLIHDLRFSESDGSTSGFNYANDELEYNCLMVSNARYCVFNPLRYIWRHRSYAIADACRLVGWSAWMDGFKKRIEKR